MGGTTTPDLWASKARRGAAKPILLNEAGFYAPLRQCGAPQPLFAVRAGEGADEM
jgi:hypothetical protein